MSEKISELEVTHEIQKILNGGSPLIATISWLPSKITIGRDGQRWLLTITEIPTE